MRDDFFFKERTKINVVPAYNLLNDNICMKTLADCIKHLEAEFEEVEAAFDELNSNGSGKEFHHLGEELADVITNAWTTLCVLEYLQDVEGFAFGCLDFVELKNKLRGYHNGR